MFRKNFLIIFMLAFIGCFIHIHTASAAPQLELKADVGVNNAIKLYTPFPLKLTITNNGSTFSGDLVIDAQATYSAGSALVIPLDLAEGETKTLSLYLDGLSDDYSFQMQDRIFTFYEGGIEKGKVVDFTGDKKIRPKFAYDGDSIYVFTFTENSDRLAALLRLKQYTQVNIDVFHLNQIPNYDFPTDVKGFEMADIIVLDEMNIADLSEEKQKVLFDWVEGGGTLLVGASDQFTRSMGIFSDYFPLNLSSEKVTVTKETLELLSKDGLFTENIEVYRATEKEGSTTILADGEKILAASIPLGEGQIIQTTFSLGDQPLSTMDGYGKLLSEILKLQTSTLYGWNGRGFLDSLGYDLKEFNELFPSFQVTTPILIITIVIYILLIGPILYLLLKKLDKREHAWWLIPVISVVLTLCIFLVGAKDRISGAQINQSAFYKVNGNSLSGYYAESILTNRSGDFTFTLNDNTSAMATRSNSYGGFSSGKLHENSYVKVHANGSSMHLRNLNYWSVQSIVGESVLPDIGNLGINLTVKESKIEGTIQNNFPFPLKDVAIWSGTKEIVVGDIEPNETITVSEKFTSSVLLRPSFFNYDWELPKTKEELIPKRIKQLKYQSINLLTNNKEPVVIGWTDQSLVGIQLEGSADVSPVAVILQSFQPKMELQGEFMVDERIMERVVYPINSGHASIANEETNEWDITPGEYEYVLYIPEELFDEKYKWKELTVTNRDMNNVELSIWNNETNSYEEYMDRSIVLQENLEKYMTEYHEFKMQIKVSDNVSTPIKLPTVEMKGVVGND